MTPRHGVGTMTPDQTRQKGIRMSSRATSAAHTGWITFAGIVLIIVGTVNTIYGLSALFRDEVLTVSGTGQVIVWDLTTWGWVLLLFGIFQFMAGCALFGGAGWARWTAIVLAGLNAVANVGFITVQPLWTLLIVALDITVIYQLAARWVPAKAYYPSYEASDAGPTAARDQMTRIGTGL
jgi:hypothetical protein